MARQRPCAQPLPDPLHPPWALKPQMSFQGSQAKPLRGQVEQLDKGKGNPRSGRGCTKKGQEELGSDAKPLLCA